MNGRKLRILTTRLSNHSISLNSLFNTEDFQQARNFIQEICSKPIIDDIIVLTGIWDTQLADYLQNALVNHYPHQKRGINNTDQRFLYGLFSFVNGGMMVFSRFPIIHQHGLSFSNLMLGFDSFLQPGGLSSIMISYPPGYIALQAVQLKSGQAFCSSLSNLWGGSEAERRAMQLQITDQHEAHWAFNPPEPYQSTHCVAAFTVGDFNTPVANLRQQHSLVDEKADNSNEIAQPEQHHFFTTHVATVPDYFTLGSTKTEAEQLEQMVTRRKHGINLQYHGLFKTEIIPLESLPNPVVRGTLDFSKMYSAEPVDPYANATLVPGNNRVSGCLTRLYNRFFSPAPYRLLPAEDALAQDKTSSKKLSSRPLSNNS